jgi:hypothetical protein
VAAVEKASAMPNPSVPPFVMLFTRSYLVEIAALASHNGSPLLISPDRAPLQNVHSPQADQGGDIAGRLKLP